ncbi:hypothetical protein B0H13DRAFT_1900856 [Mycena leptocephala]|nr:hypothetical protein B0H13DRAFT_1900856 [Mycena leptocephala]
MPLVSCQVTAPMAQVSTSARPPTYEKALALDPRLRLFMDRAPFQHYSNEAGRGMMFPAYALKDRPLNPPVCGVVLARALQRTDAALRGIAAVKSNELGAFVNNDLDSELLKLNPCTATAVSIPRSAGAVAAFSPGPSGPETMLALRAHGGSTRPSLERFAAPIDGRLAFAGLTTERAQAITVSRLFFRGHEEDREGTELIDECCIVWRAHFLAISGFNPPT